MEPHQLAPGERLNDGPPTEPRQAATIILVRGGAEALEVLLLRRNPAARFMGGAWVFPGGAVDPGDADHRATAVRELQEEAGVALPDPGALVPFSRWITPRQLFTRFDTHFFVAHAPAGSAPRADGTEMVDVGWWAPDAALAAGSAGELLLVFPTIKNLEQVARCSSADALLDWAAGREVVPIEPRIAPDGRRIVLEDEP
jgi:8-oxo-dGTP pyrophosphatase MutT (NUDIX family)